MCHAHCSIPRIAGYRGIFTMPNAGVLEIGGGHRVVSASGASENTIEVSETISITMMTTTMHLITAATQQSAGSKKVPFKMKFNFKLVLLRRNGSNMMMLFMQAGVPKFQRTVEGTP